MCKFTSNMDISTSQKLSISLSPGCYMLKNGVVVKWPENRLGWLDIGEICHVSRFVKLVECGLYYLVTLHTRQ